MPMGTRGKGSRHRPIARPPGPPSAAARCWVTQDEGPGGSPTGSASARLESRVGVTVLTGNALLVARPRGVAIGQRRRTDKAGSCHDHRYCRSAYPHGAPFSLQSALWSKCTRGSMRYKLQVWRLNGFAHLRWESPKKDPGRACSPVVCPEAGLVRPPPGDDCLIRTPLGSRETERTIASPPASTRAGERRRTGRGALWRKDPSSASAQPGFPGGAREPSAVVTKR